MSTFGCIQQSLTAETMAAVIMRVEMRESSEDDDEVDEENEVIDVADESAVDEVNDSSE